jgi:hypothetical protein
LLLLACALSARALPPPRLVSPPDGMDLTDIATFFQWAPLAGCTNFEIQIARDRGFADVVKAKRTTNKGFHKNLYFPKDVLPAGSYVWRVRAITGGETSAWSAVRAVSVNTDDIMAPNVIRRIGPEDPLFLMRSRAWDPLKHTNRVAEIVPPGFERVIVVDDIALASERVFERAQRYQELGLDFVIWNNRCQVPLATIEWLFQKYPHCIGTAEGEHFDGLAWERGPEGNLAEQDFVRRAWTLCGKYGRFYFLGDGDAGSYRWPGFADRERERFAKYRRNIVPMFKSTKGDVALHSYGAVEGLLLAGFAENTGMWVDEWIWPEAGFGALGEVIPEEQRWANRRKVGTRQCPWTYDLQMWLLGIASGATVFHLESAHQWSAEGGAQANYRRFFLPFVKAVKERKLLPSRTAFLDSAKLAVVTDLTLATGRHAKAYSGGFAFLHDLYRVSGPGDQDLIPNDSRYGIVPFLPAGTTAARGGARLVAQRELLDPSRAKALFDVAYPARFSGDAFMWACDGTVIAMATRENETVTQRFAMSLGTGVVQRIEGAIGTHQYVLGKQGAGGAFWFQTNGEYPDRAVEVSIVCARKPDWHVDPLVSADEERWDEPTKTLHLRLNHRLGAVEVELK